MQPVGEAEMKRGKDMDHTTDSRTRKHSKRSNSRHSLGSLDGDSLGPDDRQGSAGSKKSNDSGLDLGEENHGFITEYSDPDKRRTVEEGFQERDDLELGITGVQLPTRNSAKDKARLEESLVMQKLREEGLISKTTAEYKGGVTFDIVDMKMSSKLPTLPPLKLASMEKRRKKKKNLTEEEIEEKLRKAEARRKRKEQARLEKIKDLDKADQAAALSSFADYQKKKEEQNVQKLESAENNRERLLNERREKQLERERRREEVRKRKAERKALGLTTENGEIISDASELLDRQSTPQVPE